MSVRPKPVVLVILDGWGIAPAGPGNAISSAKTPNFKSLWETNIHTQLIAHGESVGLPKREPGNTETGHLNLGAGHIVYQDLPRINMSIADGSFFQNPALIAAAEHVKANQSNLHLLGLVGGGGVHSDLTHFLAVLRFCHERGIEKVFIHAFTDGRDSPPTAAITYLNQMQTVMTREGIGTFASVSGRYYAMDRDFRWDRTEKTYLCLTEGKGNSAPTIYEAISKAYASGQTDEFIEPTNILDSQNKLQGLVSDKDAVIFINFRIDRPRQLTKAFVLPDLSLEGNKVTFDPYLIKYAHHHNLDTKSTSRQKPFLRPHQIQNLFFVTMTEYEAGLPVHVAFPPQSVDNPIGRVVSEFNLKQLHVSESEKERFVTYYFNGLHEVAYPNEERMIIPSPKVATYDKRPQMSAAEITQNIIAKIKTGVYDLIVMNYANADMVGHTGNLEATIKACEFLDSCLGELFAAIDSVGGVLVITADHGNAEEMINLTTGAVDTEHNANPVPLIIAGAQYHKNTQVPQGILADVAPTILSLLQIPLPFSMTGRNLLANVN